MAEFAPEIITHIGLLPVTNTLIHTLIVDAVLITAAVYLSTHITLKPKGLQSIIEPIIDGIYNLTESIATTKKSAMQIFPFVMTFFLFIFVANFTGLLPGVGTVGFFQSNTTPHPNFLPKGEGTITESSAENPLPQGRGQGEGNATEPEHSESFIPLLRGATSDLNVTLALALISVIATHVLSIQLTGFTDYISRWISWNPINLYVGLLELVAEFTKIISLSFRLFGNIFAGEIALHTISALFAFLAPLPFLLLESIVSIVQALVFSILTLVFMAVLTTPHHAEVHSNEH